MNCTSTIYLFYFHSFGSLLCHLVSLQLSASCHFSYTLLYCLYSPLSQMSIYDWIASFQDLLWSSFSYILSSTAPPGSNNVFLPPTLQNCKFYHLLKLLSPSFNMHTVYGEDTFLPFVCTARYHAVMFIVFIELFGNEVTRFNQPQLIQNKLMMAYFSQCTPEASSVAGQLALSPCI